MTTTEPTATTDCSYHPDRFRVVYDARGWPLCQQCADEHGVSLVECEHCPTLIQPGDQLCDDCHDEADEIRSRQPH